MNRDKYVSRIRSIIVYTILKKKKGFLYFARCIRKR